MWRVGLLKQKGRKQRNSVVEIEEERIQAAKNDREKTEKGNGLRIERTNTEETGKENKKKKHTKEKKIESLFPVCENR